MPGFQATHRPLRLLALDGGGVRGLSELFILKEFMLRIQRQYGVPTPPKPCQIFDMMGGTSTGGLLAVMLGRLQMTVDQAIEEYLILSKFLFGKKQSFFSSGKYSPAKLAEAIQRMVQKYTGVNGTNAKLRSPDSPCKVFVVAKDAQMMAGSARLYRSYNSGDLNDHPDVSIFDAVRAATAAPTYLKHQEINHNGHVTALVDGALGTNNPTRLLFTEALKAFPHDLHVSCIMSIGSGKPSINISKPPSLSKKSLPVLDTVSSLMQLATDSERVAQEVGRKFSRVPNIYYRLSVDHGLGDIRVDDYQQMGNIKSLTMAYLGGYETVEKIDKASWATSSDRAARLSLRALA